MKMNINDMNNHINEEEKKDQGKRNISNGLPENNLSNVTFAAIDLWRLQKKHKTLGSSTRWQPL